MKKYRVIEDYQGGDFGMGRDCTAEEWLEQATEWRDSDDSWGDWGDGDIDTREGWLEFWHELIANNKEQELIDYISDMWQIRFEEIKE